MLTGADIRQMLNQGQQATVMASRLYGTTYVLGVQLGPDEYAGPVITPGSGEALKFDSLDEIASFLLQAGIKTFQTLM